MSDTGYPITLSNGTRLGGGTTEILDISQVANSIADTTLTSLSLQRRGARNYSEITAENLVHLLENFAAPGAPAHPLHGQLWFNPSAGASGQLMLYNTSNNWIPAGNPQAASLANAVNIAITGAVSGSAAFDGSSNISIAVIPQVIPGLAPGTYAAPTITIDSGGRITAASGSTLGSGSVIGALGYTPANDALVVHKSGDTMTGTLNVTNADVNTTGTGLIKQNGFALIPTGGIIMWSGSSSSVPGGWHLCDGTNGTPNLLGKFIVSTGGNGGYADGATGGVNLVSSPTTAAGAHSHNVIESPAGAHTHGGTGAYALTVNDLPPHQHATDWGEDNDGLYPAKYGWAPTGNANKGSGNTDFNNGEYMTSNVGGGLGHSHPISSDGSHTHTAVTDTASTHTHTASWDNRPEYYALAFIMKL